MPSVSVALPFMMLSSLLPFRVIVVITGTFKVVSATFLSKVAVAGLMVGGVVSSTPMTRVAVLGAPMAFAGDRHEVERQGLRSHAQTGQVGSGERH